MPSHTYTQIRGHGLKAEGKPYADNGEGGWMHLYQQHVGRGLCSCGATSEVLESDAARKRWHKDHKAEVSATPPATLRPPARQGAPGSPEPPAPR